MALKFSTAALEKFIKNSKGFDRVFDKVKVVTFGDGQCSVEMKVDHDHTNPMGGLHGGLSATLIDSISTFALMSKLGPEITHVSVDIHLSYLKGAKIDDNIVVDAKVLKSGKKLAFLEAVIKNKETGDLLVKGSHTKAIVPGIGLSFM